MCLAADYVYVSKFEDTEREVLDKSECKMVWGA